MASVQCMDGNKYSSFRNLANDYMQYLMTGFKHGDTVVDIFDRYDVTLSAKGAERDRRAGMGNKEYEVKGGRPIPHWKRFLDVPANKQKLIRYLGDHIVENAESQAAFQPNCKLYLAGCFQSPVDVKLLHAGSLVGVPNLNSNHEEGDTRIILHAMHADQSFAADDLQGRIIIRCHGSRCALFSQYVTHKGTLDSNWHSDEHIRSTKVHSSP